MGIVRFSQRFHRADIRQTGSSLIMRVMRAPNFYDANGKRSVMMKRKSIFRTKLPMLT